MKDKLFNKVEELPESTPNDPLGGARDMVRTIGIVALFCGVGGLSWLPLGFLPFTKGQWAYSETSPQAVWLVCYSIMSLALSLFLLVAGVGCLWLRSWGRGAMIGYSIPALLLGIAGMFFFVRWLVAAENTSQVQRALVTLAPLCWWPVDTLIAIWALYYLTRPKAKAVFADRENAVPPGEA